MSWKNGQILVRFADGGEDENVSVISSSWCRTKAGICLTFGISIEVLSVDEISEFGKEFVKAVKKSYGKMLKEYFYPKSESPLVSPTPKGEIIMIWTFLGNDDEETERLLSEEGIEEIDFN